MFEHNEERHYDTLDRMSRPAPDASLLDPKVDR
jgi:hypothetical protein